MAAVETHPKLPTSPRLRGLTVLFAVVAGLVVMLAWSWWSYASERDAIVDLPAAERKALYERTLQSLKTTCRAGSAGLADYCAEQAELIVKFPECDRACRELAQSYGPRPTR